MKRIFYSLILTFSLLILSNVESNGQCSGCSSPYASQTATYVYNSSCSITINFCLDCSPTGHPIMKLCSITIPYNSNCYNIPIDPTFWNNIRNEMLIKAALVCGTFGPCPQRIAADIYQATCWKLENDWELGMVHIVPCDEEPGSCMQEYEVC